MATKPVTNDYSTYKRRFWQLFMYGFLGIIFLFLFASWGFFGKMPSFDDLENPKSQLDEIFDPSQSNNRQQQIADLQAENTRLQAENADLLKRITKLESEPNQATATPADKLLEEEDPRTINNLLRLLLAINEMAKAKNGKYVDFFSQDLKNNLEKISTQLDLLGYKHIGDEAYKTIRTMIRERNDKL